MRALLVAFLLLAACSDDDFGRSTDASPIARDLSATPDGG
jgi:hypothetical protein